MSSDSQKSGFRELELAGVMSNTLPNDMSSKTSDQECDRSTISDSTSSPLPPGHSSISAQPKIMEPESPIPETSYNDIRPPQSIHGDFKPLLPNNPQLSIRFLTQGSFISRLSQYSGTLDKVDEIGQLPSHNVVRAEIASVVELPVNLLSKLNHVRHAPVIEEDCLSELGSSCSSQHPLPLPTVVKNYPLEDRNAARKPPDAQYNTTIEAPVPARSKRRPLSEIVVISESADKLAEKAAKQTRRRSLDSSHHLNNHLTKIMHDASSIQSFTENDEHINTPPDHKPLQRSYTPTDEYNETGSPEAALNTSTSSYYSDSVGVQYPQNDHDIDLMPLPLFSSLDERRRHTPRINSIKSLPPRPTRESIIKAKASPVELARHILQRGDSELEDMLSCAERKGLWKNTSSLGNENTIYVDPTQEAELLSKTRKEEDIEEDRDEDDYIDIGEATPSSSPLKPSTSKRRRSRRTASRAKSINGKATQLKPFTYSTLVSLLESMNGTIIGEEFNQLDLPPLEKLLMEKIIDSLSRLTLEMVIDQSIYDVGIRRLEKALRVLEGFD